MTSIHERERNLCGDSPENKTLVTFHPRTGPEIEKMVRVVESADRIQRPLGDGTRVPVPPFILSMGCVINVHGLLEVV